MTNGEFMIIHFAELFAHAGARKRMYVFAPGSYSKAKPKCSSKVGWKARSKIDAAISTVELQSN